MNIHNHHLSLRIIKCEVLSRASENSSSRLNSLFATYYDASRYPTFFFFFFLALHFKKASSYNYSVHNSEKKRAETGIAKTCGKLLENEQPKI